MCIVRDTHSRLHALAEIGGDGEHDDFSSSAQRKVYMVCTHYSHASLALGMRT